MKVNFASFIVVACSMITISQAFVTTTTTSKFCSSTRCQNRAEASQMKSSSNDIGNTFGGEGSGGIEEIEFRIYPDGRVSEVVRGVKGTNCEKVTESINKQLGRVVDSSPTEEMYEQELVIDQTVEQKLNGGDGSWDGASTW